MEQQDFEVNEMVRVCVPITEESCDVLHCDEPEHCPLLQDEWYRVVFVSDELLELYVPDIKMVWIVDKKAVTTHAVYSFAEELD